MSTTRLREMQEDLTGVGPGMGEFIRQYWIPAALSSEYTPRQIPFGRGFFWAADDVDWRDVYDTQMASVEHPAPNPAPHYVATEITPSTTHRSQP